MVLGGYQGADVDAEQLAFTEQLFDAALGDLSVVARGQPCLLVGDFNCARACSCFNTSKFQWVARPDSGTGTRPKKHAVFKFPFLAVMLVPGQQRLAVFWCSPPTSSLTGVVAGTGMVQSGAPVVSSKSGTGSSLSESETFLLPVSCALTADVDGGFELKGELQGGHSSLCFWPEESVQFHNLEMKGDLGDAGHRSRFSLRRWPQNTEQFHEPESKGEMIGSRRRVTGKRGQSSLRRWREKTEPFRVPQMKGAFFGRRRRGGCFAEARSGSDLDVSHSFDLSSVRVESPLSRVQRVTAALHGHHNACDTHNSQNSYSVHGACGVLNSENSVGDTEAGGQRFCVYGETKSLSTSTRSGVRRSAVCESAYTQQTPLKLRVEAWAGLLRNQGPKIFREVEIVPGCAVEVACPSCPDYSPEPPGQGRIIRNMLGWSKLEKIFGSGVWLFRGALQKKNLFSSLVVARDWERKGSYRTASAVACDSSCTCSHAYGRGPAIGPHAGERCWPLLAGAWRAIAPLMKPWCAEEGVPIAANLNLYRGWNSCVGWHCDDEPLFGEYGDAKLIVSVSLGSSAVVRWRRQSCPDDEGHFCPLGHGDILVMDGQPMSG